MSNLFWNDLSDRLVLTPKPTGSTLNNNLAMWVTRKAELQAQTSNGATACGMLVPVRSTVTVTQDRGIEFQVTVCTFVPESDDVTAWKWEDSGGVERKMEMPPYAICDMAEAARNMQLAIIAGKEEYINGLLDAANPICRRTFEEAFKHLESPGVSRPHWFGSTHTSYISFKCPLSWKCCVG